MIAVRSLVRQIIQGQAPRLSRVWPVLILTALYVLLSVTVHLRMWTGFDLTVTVYLERQVPRSLDLWLSLLSLIGSAEVTGFLVLAYAFLFCPKESLIGLVVSFFLIAIIEWVGKNIIYQPNTPSIFYHSVRPLSFPTASVETPYSFPSGHSARSVFVTVVLVVWIQHSHVGARVKQALLALLAMVEMIMLVSRVSLGEHWSTDVIGGALLATALALLWLDGLKPDASRPAVSHLSGHRLDPHPMQE